MAQLLTQRGERDFGVSIERQLRFCVVYIELHIWHHLVYEGSTMWLHGAFEEGSNTTLYLQKGANIAMLFT